MRWIKTIVWIILGLMAIIAISLFAFKRYRIAQAEKIKIPEETISVIRINVDQMMVEMFKNSLTNYKAYFGAKKDAAGERAIKFWKAGIEIPATVYFFSLKDSTDQFYSVFKINDLSKFKTFVKQKLVSEGDSSKVLDRDTEFRFSLKHFSMIANAERAVFSLHKSTISPDSMMVSLLKDQQETWQSADNFANMAGQLKASDFSFINLNNDWMTLDFQIGKGVFNGHFHSKAFGFPEKTVELIHDDQHENRILHFFINSDLALIIRDRKDDLAKLKLPVDSLHRYIGNFADLQVWDRETKQLDTIISYDYDDNFEMKEKKELHEVSAPVVALQLRASPHLLGYLPDKLFYKFHRSVNNGLVQLATADTSLQEVKFQPSKQVMRLVYRKRDVGAKYFGWLPFYESIRYVDIKGTAHARSELDLQGEFLLKNMELHGLFQLIEDQ